MALTQYYFEGLYFKWMYLVTHPRNSIFSCNYYRIGNFIKQTISYIDVLDLLILVEFAKPDYPRELTYIVNQRMHSEIYDIFFHKDLLYYIF